MKFVLLAVRIGGLIAWVASFCNRGEWFHFVVVALLFGIWAEVMEMANQ